MEHRDFPGKDEIDKISYVNWEGSEWEHEGSGWGRDGAGK